MKTNTYAGIFLMLSIPLILLTCNTFADENTIEELHKESAILVSQERYNEALDVFDQILEIDSDNVKALNHKGALLVKMENFQQSLEYFDKAIIIEPNNIKILKNKAIALSHLNQHAKAIAIYEKILELEPTNEWAEIQRNDLLLPVELVKTETQSKYLIHVTAVVSSSDGVLVSVYQNIASDFLPSKLFDKFLDESFVSEGIVMIDNKKYEKMTKLDHWTEDTGFFTCEFCVLNDKVIFYGTLTRVGMLTDEQMTHYTTGYFPAIVVNEDESVTETWNVFRQID